VTKSLFLRRHKIALDRLRFIQHELLTSYRGLKCTCRFERLLADSRARDHRLVISLRSTDRRAGWRFAFRRTPLGAPVAMLKYFSARKTNGVEGK